MSRVKRAAHPALRWIVGWTVLAVLVFAAARTLDWDAALDAAATASMLWLWVAVLANGAILVLTAVEWLVFVPRGSVVHPWTMFSIAAISSSWANGGPPLAALAAGVHLLATRGGLGHAGGVSVTFLGQVVEGVAKWCLVVLAAATVPGFAYRTAGLVVGIGVPALLVGALIAARSRHLMEDLARSAAGWSGTAIRFVADTLHRLEALRSPRRLAAGAALAVLRKGAEALGIVAVATSLGVTLPPWAVLAALLAVNLTTMVSLTPANLGTFEGAAFLVYRAAGVDTGTALALSVLQHAVYLIPMAGTGWLVMLVPRLSRSPGSHAAWGTDGPTPPNV